MTLYWPYFLADYYLAIEYLIAGFSIIILVSSLDDLFIDLWFFGLKLKRSLTIWRKYKPLQPEQIIDRPEQHMAIMLPAWLEYDVIALMLENMVKTLDYRSYTIFAGTYQNDRATIEEVERMRMRYKQLIRVEVPHDGPTCKADCLNWIVQAIFKHEKETGISYAGMVLHDSEDVLHPLELRFFNYILPRIDLIQLPVSSLERHWSDLIAGVYMDEFAESHDKDMVVRESMTNMVPSAGVGTCFSRRAMMTLVAETDNQPFNTQTLTEDYDIGVRLARHGMRSILARFMVTYRVKRSTWFGYGPEKEYTIRMPMSVREYFPNTFKTSYRQKARWSLGICFQGWMHFGWQGTLADRYFLLRDRKGVITSFLSIASYILAIHFSLFQLAFYGEWATVRYPPLLSFDGWLIWIVWACIASLFIRIAERFYFTSKTFGWEHGLLSIPRMVIGNFVNFMAMSRAWKQFLEHIFFGKRLVWDKTMHDFPTEEGLVSHRPLGDLLVEWQAIDRQKLAGALEDQKQSQRPLGRILMGNGWLDETTLAEAIAFQFSMKRIAVERKQLLAAKDIVPLDLSIRWRTLALIKAGEEGGAVVLGVTAPLTEEALRQFHAILGYTPMQRIICEGELSAGLRLLRGGSQDKISETLYLDTKVPLFGDIVVDLGMAKRQDIEEAMQDYVPHRDGLIGEFLVVRGLLTNECLKKAIKEQRRLIDNALQQEMVDA